MLRIFGDEAANDVQLKINNCRNKENHLGKASLEKQKGQNQISIETKGS